MPSHGCFKESFDFYKNTVEVVRTVVKDNQGQGGKSGALQYVTYDRKLRLKAITDAEASKKIGTF